MKGLIIKFLEKAFKIQNLFYIYEKQLKCPGQDFSCYQYFSHFLTSKTIKKAPLLSQGGPLWIWRRGRDSNPGSG